MYFSLTAHVNMNSDVHRNTLYGKAIAGLVKPGDVVMDLGAGLGMLGFLAASQQTTVHFVEPEQLVEIPRQVAAAHGFEQCHFHRAKVEDLPDIGPVDVITSVFTGNFLLTEDLLPSLFNARDRFLAPGGRLIPHCAKMVVQPVSCPQFYHDNIEQYSSASALGVTIDYPMMRQYLVNTLYYDYFNAIDHVCLGAPQSFHHLDFYSAISTACDDGITATIDHGGTCHGWLGWFDIGLGEEWLSTSPAANKTHWRQVFLPLREPLDVAPGDTLGFHLHRPEQGDWTWTTKRAGISQRMSTFLSGPVDLAQLRKLGNSHRPRLNAKGEAARWVLDSFTGDLSLEEICTAVLHRFPGLFASKEKVHTWVKGFVSRYSLDQPSQND